MNTMDELERCQARLDAIERQLSERPTWADLREVIAQGQLGMDAYDCACRREQESAARAIAASRSVATPPLLRCSVCGSPDWCNCDKQPVAKAPDEPTCPWCRGGGKVWIGATPGEGQVIPCRHESHQQNQRPSVASMTIPNSSSTKDSMGSSSDQGESQSQPAPSSAAELRDAVAEWRDSSSHGFYTSTRIILGDRVAAAASRAVEEIRYLTKAVDMVRGERDTFIKSAELIRPDRDKWQARAEQAEAERDEARRHAQAGYDAIAKAHRDGYMCHPAIVDWQQSFHKRARHQDAAQGGGD